MSFTFHTRPGTTDDRIVREVYTNNHYRVPADMTGLRVIDFGANIGAFSILCAERGAFVLAYEPEPCNYQLLLRHIKEAGLDKNIITACTGVGILGVSKLYVNESNYGAGSTNLSNNIGLVEDKFVYAQMIDFDLITDTADMWKVDCEGGEVYLLQQALNNNALPKTLMVEFHGSAQDNHIKYQLSHLYDVTTISDHEFIYHRRTA